MAHEKKPNRAFRYSDYQPKDYSMPYSLMPVEGQGVYIDGTETEYKDVWTTGDAYIRDKNAYMAEMAKKQAAEDSVRHKQDAEKWFANPENQKKLEPGYIDPHATFNLANLRVADAAEAKANADFARAFFDLKREGTYNSESLKDLKLKK